MLYTLNIVIFVICILHGQAWFLDVVNSLPSLNQNQNYTRKYLVHNEINFTKSLKDHINHVNIFLTQIQRHYEHLSNTIGEITDKQKYLENAMNRFSLLKRATKEWKVTTKTINSLPGKFNPTRKNELNNRLNNSFAQIEFISDAASLKSGIRGISRLQNVYNLRSDVLANGKLEGALSHSKLTAEDCFEFAKYNFNSYKIDKTSEWLEETMKRVVDFCDSGVSKTEVLEIFFIVKCYTGDDSASMEAFTKLVTEHPSFTLTPSLNQHYDIIMKHGCKTAWEVFLKKLIEQMYGREAVESHEDNKSNIEDNREQSTIKKNEEEDLRDFIDIEFLENFLELCKYQAVYAKTAKNLKCRFVHYKKPELMLGPFKIEELHLDPPVIRFYDVISDTEIEELTSYGKPHMQMAYIYNLGNNTNSEFAEARTSQQLWIPDEKLPLSARLSRRVARFTGFDLYLAELNQLASYSVGGEFKPHVDSLTEEGMKVNPSFADYAVVMFYLNSVEKGGHTIFPALNVSVVPEKGSAVLWFNRRPDGARDISSVHAGCPVLQGTKWVINKWFHRLPQDLPKCTMKKNSSFKYFYI